MDMDAEIADMATAMAAASIQVDLVGLGATAGVDEAGVRSIQEEEGGDLEAVAERLYARGAYLVRSILKPVGTSVVAGGGGTRVVWDEENLARNLAERPEGGYMKIDEPDTPFEYTMKPISDSEDSEDEGGAMGLGGGGGGGGGMAFDEAAFAAAFDAKRHTVVQGVHEGGGGTEGGLPAAAAAGVAPSGEMDMDDAESTTASASPQYQCVTVVPGAGAGPGEIDGSKPERFQHMEAAHLAKHKEKRSAHYDEFRKLQEYKRRLAAGELTEDDY